MTKEKSFTTYSPYSMAHGFHLYVHHFKAWPMLSENNPLRNNTDTHQGKTLQILHGYFALGSVDVCLGVSYLMMNFRHHQTKRSLYLVCDSRCWLNIYRVLYTYMSTYTYAHTHIWVHSPEMRSLSRLLALWRQEPVQAGITPPVSGSLQRVGGVMDWMLVSPQNPYVETLVPIWWYLKGRPLGGNQIMKDGALMNGALMNGISALIRRGQRAS